MKNILFIGAHPDDIEITSGGTISKFRNKYNIQGLILTNYATDREIEAKKGMKVLGINYIHLNFEDTTLFNRLPELINSLLIIFKDNDIDTVFTHSNDSHTDHKAVFQATISAARKTIENLFIYQPAYPSTLATFVNHFSPNLIVSLSELNIKNKIKALKCHKSQIEKYGEIEYLNIIKAIAKANSLEFANNIKGYAEVFQSLRQLV